MRVPRGFRIFVVLIVLSFLSLVFRPSIDVVTANHDSQFFKSNTGGGFEPMGIDFGFRLNEPGLFNEPRMLVTRPRDGNPRQLHQRDADGSAFFLRATLLDRPDNQPYSDAVAVVPATLGLASITAGFNANEILVSQGLSVYRVTGNGPAPVPAPQFAPVAAIPVGAGANESHCTSPNSTLTYDRWAVPGTGFGGQAILTCTRPGFIEIWTFNGTGGFSKVADLPGTYSGRPDITSPNFLNCGGCLAVVDDNTLNVTLVTGAGATSTVNVGFSAGTGRRNTLTVPPRVYQFQPAGNGGCLFGTLPLDNAIRQFPCTSSPNVFENTTNGDLLIFTASGAVVRIKATDGTALLVHSGVPNFEDVAFPSLRVVGLIVHQPAAGNPNKGVQGNFVFYILSGDGFNPQTQVNVQSIRFGATGNEDSVSNCVNVGTDVNGDGQSDLKCSADVQLAMCDEVTIQCIVTGFTLNQTAFDGW